MALFMNDALQNSSTLGSTKTGGYFVTIYQLLLEGKNNILLISNINLIKWHGMMKHYVEDS
jgi:hypothetical protein